MAEEKTPEIEFELRDDEIDDGWTQGCDYCNPVQTAKCAVCGKKPHTP